MNSPTRKPILITAFFALASVAAAQKTSIQLPADNTVSQLKSGPGDETARKDCSLCHSTDYIVRQPRLGAQQWDAEVKKMIAVYGAPIGATDAKVISDYLEKKYGTETATEKKREPAKP